MVPNERSTGLGEVPERDEPVGERGLRELFALSNSCGEVWGTFALCGFAGILEARPFVWTCDALALHFSEKLTFVDLCAGRGQGSLVQGENVLRLTRLKRLASSGAALVLGAGVCAVIGLSGSVPAGAVPNPSAPITYESDCTTGALSGEVAPFITSVGIDTSADQLAASSATFDVSGTVVQAVSGAILGRSRGKSSRTVLVARPERQPDLRVGGRAGDGNLQLHPHVHSTGHLWRPGHGFV